MVMTFEHTENPPILSNPLRRKKYLTRETATTMSVSTLVHERLLRRRLYPSETVAHVLDRILENDGLIFDVYYDKTQTREKTSIVVSINARQKLKTLKIENNLKTMNEVLWRLMSNAANK
jgi:hypothetical protein